MEPNRVVEILQDGKSRGSGYLITTRHVLTARHVSKPPEVGTNCVVHPLRDIGEQAMPSAQKPRPQPVPAKVGWVSAEHDFALIEITGDPLGSPKTGPIPFGEIPADGVARQIVGSGFPEAAGVDQRTIIGTLSWVLAGSRRFDIDVISAIPRDWRKWGGFSGAAIFVDNILVGVVRTVDENWSGKVLQATPAAWLLEDSRFKKYFEDAKLSCPDTLDVGAADRIMPLDFEADASIEGTLRFSPRNPHVPFLGREAALRALDEFLTVERRPPFAWWLVTGGGGAGKTRLARELCLRMRRRGWRAGFLPSAFVADISSLDAWCPRTPTLLVADYVMKRIEEIRKLCARLARRDGLPSLRLLLLEREAGTLFENQFLGSDQSDRGVIEQARYQPDPLSLPELTEDEIWDLVEACPWRRDAARVPLTRKEFFQRLRELDSQRRPLVAMILADALTISAVGAHGGLETVLRDLLQRDRDHLWPKELGVAKTAIGKTEADVAIAFATMVDGLGPPELDAIKVARGGPIDTTILPACGLAIGRPLGSVACLGRLEPDLIGEFFALETLRSDPNNPFVTEPPHSWMPKAAWRARGGAMRDFVNRVNLTFPKHVALQHVNITVEGVIESWFHAATVIVFRAKDWTAGIADALKWMRLHAESDASAALAFANLTLIFVNGAHIELSDIVSSMRVVLLDDLGALVRRYCNDVTVRQALARSFVEVLKAEGGGAFDRRDWVDELRALAHDYPDDVTLRAQLAEGLNDTIGYERDFDRQGTLIDELRTLARDYPDDITVREKLASGLLGSQRDVPMHDLDRQDTLIDKLRALARDYPNDESVRQNLAQGLMETLSHGYDFDRRDALLDELRALARDYPNDESVRQNLADGLARIPLSQFFDRQDALLDELRALARDYPDDRNVSADLVDRLYYAFKYARAERDLNRRDALLDEQLVLARYHPDDGSISQTVAYSLSVALMDASAERDLNRRDALLDELRAHARGYLNSADSDKFFWMEEVLRSLLRGLCIAVVDALIERDGRAVALFDELRALSLDYLTETLNVCKREAQDLVKRLNEDDPAVVREFLEYLISWLTELQEQANGAVGSIDRKADADHASAIKTWLLAHQKLKGCATLREFVGAPLAALLRNHTPRHWRRPLAQWVLDAIDAWEVHVDGQ